jgi:hypothetical protein
LEENVENGKKQEQWELKKKRKGCRTMENDKEGAAV